jgi:hypothetical protein
VTIEEVDRESKLAAAAISLSTPVKPIHVRPLSADAVDGQFMCELSAS